jgi:integrase/recombinase XerC
MSLQRAPAIIAPIPLVVPGIVADAGGRATERYVEFFASTIRNKNTREAYRRAAERFFGWCARAGLTVLPEIRSLHVATYVEGLMAEVQAPTVKQHLAALRMLFDWLVVGQVIAANPTASVRGPRHRVDQGLTPAPTGPEVDAILQAIDVSKPSGLRDRALIAVMVFTFARISAALALKVADVELRGRRLHLMLKEKGGKVALMPCQHRLEEYLEAYLDGCSLRENAAGMLFRTVSPTTGQLQETGLNRKDAYAMVRRRVLAAGITMKVGNHSFRATGITAYLKNGGTVEKARRMANHASARTTQLYDRRPEEVTLDEVERIILT